jgi:prepilin-type N-terminal cleavage/methylation domain-containing protein
MRSRGFTLIELLIVVTIIAILAGLALPAFQTALTSAKKSQASAMISQLQTAIAAFNTEYGVWPSSTEAPSADSQLLPTDAYLILSAKETDSNPQNSRGIVFLEFSARDLYPLSRPPGTKATGIADPWSASMKNYTAQNYQIWVDTSYDGEIHLSTPWNQTVNSGVAIWDPGAPHNGKVNTNPNTMVRSW